MFDNNHQNPSCTFAEQTISYIYEEIDVSGKAAFETHLKTCAHCTDQIAGFGYVRSSILDWRREEFLSLEIPKIEIPKEKKEKLPLTVSVSNSTQSWIGKLQEFLTVSPIWATAAALLLITVLVGLIVIKHNFSDTNQTAQTGSRNGMQTNVSAKLEGNSEIASENGSNKSAILTKPEKPFYPNDIKAKESLLKNSQPAQSHMVVRTSNNVRSSSQIEVAARNPKILSPVRKFDASNFVAANTASATKAGRIPKLNNIEEEEEETLRLADLLDEAGGK